MTIDREGSAGRLSHPTAVSYLSPVTHSELWEVQCRTLLHHVPAILGQSSPAFQQLWAKRNQLEWIYITPKTGLRSTCTYLTHGSEVRLDVDSHLQKLQEAPRTKFSGTEQELYHHGPGTSEGPGELQVIIAQGYLGSLISACRTSMSLISDQFPW